MAVSNLNVLAQPDDARLPALHSMVSWRVCRRSHTDFSSTCEAYPKNGAPGILVM
jgi:hypothetical protein